MVRGRNDIRGSRDGGRDRECSLSAMPSPRGPTSFPLVPFVLLTTARGWCSEGVGVPSLLSNLVSKCFGQHPPGKEKEVQDRRHSPSAQSLPHHLGQMVFVLTSYSCHPLLTLAPTQSPTHAQRLCVLRPALGGPFLSPRRSAHHCPASPRWSLSPGPHAAVGHGSQECAQESGRFHQGSDTRVTVL